MDHPFTVKSAIKKITCIQLSGEFPDFCHRLVMPDYGMPLIGSILSEAGYEVTIFMEHIQAPDWNCIASSDLVCMSTLSAAAEKTYRLASKIRRQLHIPVILGGTHATYFPESCLNYCDYVVMGEGDETILELCAALSKGEDVSRVAGIAFNKNGQMVRTPGRPGVKNFDTIPDFSLIKGYKKFSFLESLVKLRFPLLTVQSTRGCSFSCKYCIVNTMFSGGYTTRSIESVIRDLHDKRQYGRELLFVDNNFSINRVYTKKLLKRMIEEDFGFDIMVLTRIDAAGDDELLHLMRRAGITQLYQGYESIQPETLAAYDKRQSVEKIVKAIEKLHSFGFRLSGSFVIGADTDTLETIRSTTQFVLEQKLTIAYLFPLWGHYQEEKNNDRSLIPRYRSIFKGWPYCDGNFVTYFPLLMRPSILQRELINAHRKIFSHKMMMKSLWHHDYIGAWEKFIHRWMWSIIEKSAVHYIPWLEDLEKDLYDSNERLIESRLKERVQDPLWPIFPGNLPVGFNDGEAHVGFSIDEDKIGCFTPNRECHDHVISS